MLHHLLRLIDFVPAPKIPFLYCLPVFSRTDCHFKYRRKIYTYISLGDIHNMPTFWVLALFGNFYNFCFHVQTCRHLGGGGGVCVYFLTSARKRHFRNVWVGGGGFAIFQRSTAHWMVHTNMALHRSSIFIQNHCHRQHSFFQAGLGPH